MKKLFVIVVAILLQGCYAAPKTPDEFKQGVKQGKGMTKYVTLDIKRKFSDVFTSVKTGSDACFNFSKPRVVQGATGRIEPNFVMSESYITGNNSGEMIIKQNGCYMLVTEIRGATKNTSTITIYGMSFAWDSVFSAIESWARGNRAKCP